MLRQRGLCALGKENSAMTQIKMPQPAITSRDEWLTQRKELLTREKALTKERDQISAARRRLPMVRLGKDYVFEGPEGKQSLRDLFGAQPQLLVYHFMFDPDWDTGCSGCTGYVDALGEGDLALLAECSTRFVLVSRAPLAKLEAYKAARGWPFPWYSSFGSEFNYDFHVTLDETVAPVEYNYKLKAEMDSPGQGEAPGLSVFFRDADAVYHTYSVFARGVENLTDSYSLLDMTPYGRQEDWEDSPPGWPQKPTYG